MFKRLLFAGFLLTIAIFVLGISFYRFSQVHVGAEDKSRSSGSAVVRLQELFNRPILPDHPLYPLKMMRDRLRIVFTPPFSRTFLDIELANERLLSAQQLLKRHKVGLSLTTVTKGEKYLLLAVGYLPQVPKGEHYNAVQNLNNTIIAHKEALQLMEATMRGDQRAVIDQLILQLSSISNRIQ